MQQYILQPIRGIIVLILLMLAMLTCSLFALLIAPFVFAIPAKSWRLIGKRILLYSPLWWMDLNRLIMKISTHRKWDIQGSGDLSPQKWYLLISNHSSWLDIIVLGAVFNRKIPVLKFFMKKELLWTLPFAGLVCYILGYPFMERHTRSDIRNKPDLKNKDIETTRLACQKFRELPTTIMNFVEGTRYSEEKHEQQKSPFYHLLKPKSTGAALVIEELQDILAGIVNVTIHYETDNISLWDFACGNFKKLQVRYELLPLEPKLIGDCYNDREFRKQFQAWLNDVWALKAKTLASMHESIRIATRNSPLALWQANYVRDLLKKRNPHINFKLVELVTRGDKELNKPLTEIGGKSLFVKELQQAMLEDKADFAVHSIKDMSVHPHAELTLAAICEREDPRDVFVSNQYKNLSELPHGAVVGSSSPRRQSLLKAKYPHLNVKILRGNVNTRLAKLDSGEYDAIILAAAGLKRLGYSDRIREYLDPFIFVPAIGQGALGIECRKQDLKIFNLLQNLNHSASRTCIEAERAVNRKLNGDCHTPIGVYATLHGGMLQIKAMVGSLNGTFVIEESILGESKNAELLGTRLADRLIERGANKILNGA